MGIHASPTCTMVYGDNGGATGYLVGEENRGMQYMFVMMNRARLAIGAQGVAIAEAATQHAASYARDRKQGRTATMNATQSAPIIEHVDVKRMLMTMRAMTNAARAICYATAVALDRSQLAKDEKARKAADERASLLTPVAKAFSTDIATEVSSLGIQVHGGMGFIEETGAAQFYRDARITQIYEGTNGIQSIDLVMRKLPMSGGAAVRGYIGELRKIVADVNAANDPAFGATGKRLGEAIDALERATEWLLPKIAGEPEAALAGATPYLRLFGTAAGGCMLAKDALAAARGAANRTVSPPQLMAAARFFATNIAIGAAGLAETVIEGADSIDAVPAELLG
jgi:hypothetical protein